MTEAVIEDAKNRIQEQARGRPGSTLESMAKLKEKLGAPLDEDAQAALESFQSAFKAK